jgi:hypothetical protein
MRVESGCFSILISDQTLVVQGLVLLLSVTCVMCDCTLHLASLQVFPIKVGRQFSRQAMDKFLVTATDMAQRLADSLTENPVIVTRAQKTNCLFRHRQFDEVEPLIASMMPATPDRVPSKNVRKQVLIAIDKVYDGTISGNHSAIEWAVSSESLLL